MSVLFSSLVAEAIPKLQSLLDGRTEPYTDDVTVANKAIPGERRMVTLHQGPGSGDFDTLDETTLRVNVYADDEADAEDLALMVRALCSPAGLVDGDPITKARVTAGPVEIANDTDLYQWYSVVDLTRRGSQLT